MTGWSEFPFYGMAAIVLWSLGAGLSLRHRRQGGDSASISTSHPGTGTEPIAGSAGSLLFLAGTLLFGLFILLYWRSIGHVPMRTMGETRLWYSLFLALTGWVLFVRWRYRFLLPFSAVIASVFTLINIFRPEIHTQTLMPALQSAWFFPHVAIYMLSYAIMAAALAVAAASLLRHKEMLGAADRLVRIGSALLILGMLSGAVWADRAWGNYWAWDAKESWAAVTWLLSLSYIHFRLRRPTSRKAAVALLAVTFLALQITWYGIKYMPSSKKSLHTYTLNR